MKKRHNKKEKKKKKKKPSKQSVQREIKHYTKLHKF